MGAVRAERGLAMVDVVQGAGTVGVVMGVGETADKAAGGGVDGSESLAEGRGFMAAVRMACASGDSCMDAVRRVLASGVSGTSSGSTFLAQTVVLPPATAEGEVAAIMAASNRGEVDIFSQGFPVQVPEELNPWE